MIDHFKLGAELNQKLDDGNTLRAHLEKIRKDYASGKFGENPRVRNSYSDLEKEESFSVPAEFSNAVFLAGKLRAFSFKELKAASELYGFNLSPLELDVILDLNKVVLDVNSSS